MRGPLIFAAMVVATSQLGSTCNKCGDCDDALDHMASKLPLFGCDPSIMEDAQERIRQDCEDATPSANAMIGALVESCHGGAPSSDCQAPLSGVPVVVVLRNDLPATAGVDLVGFTVTAAGKMEDVDGLAPGASTEIVLSLSEGDTVDVSAVDVATGDALALSEEVTTHIRVTPGDWTPYRKREFSLTGDGTFFDLLDSNW